jgi:hypothetical protein
MVDLHGISKGKGSLQMIDLRDRAKRTPSSDTENSSPKEHASMTLTKDHLISSIGNRLGISKSDSTRILESVLETVKTSLSNGEDVLISGLRFRDF